VRSTSFVTALYLGIALVCVVPASWAHHSGAMFDKTRTIQIRGVVKEFLWTNPHASFKVEVPGAGGEPQLWLIEMNAPGNLVHEGWKRNTVKAGDQVTVTSTRSGMAGRVDGTSPSSCRMAHRGRASPTRREALHRRLRVRSYTRAMRLTGRAISSGTPATTTLR
jgi:uncharacterized protein DUF6152